jgi:hypothetical protein
MVVPIRIMKLMLPDEDLIICLRRHPVLLLRPIAIILAAVTMAIAMHTLRESLVIEIIVWVLSVIFAYSAVILSMDWYLGYFVVTRQRLILPSSTFSSVSETVRVNTISDVEVYRSMSGKLLGYGDLIFSTGSKGKFTLNCLRYPVQLYLEISQLLRGADL